MTNKVILGCVRICVVLCKLTSGFKLESHFMVYLEPPVDRCIRAVDRICNALGRLGRVRGYPDYFCLNEKTNSSTTSLVV